MKFGCRAFLNLAAVAGALLVFSIGARAQVYPSRPITLIVPFRCRRADGYDRPDRHRGDALVAWSTDHHRKRWRGRRQHRRRPRARAAPDGYTISIGNVATHVLNGAAYPLSYDLLNDFESISLLTNAPAFIDARNTLPPKDLKELIAWLQVQS